MLRKSVYVIGLLAIIATMGTTLDASASMTVLEQFDPDTSIVEFTVTQTSNDIAGFAVGVADLHMYDGPWIENAYGESQQWEAFRVTRNDDGDWVRQFAGVSMQVKWLEGWGEGYEDAYAYADMGLEPYLAWLENPGPDPDEGPDEPTYLMEAVVDGWFGTIDQPYSPFRGVSIDHATPSVTYIDGETVVPIPGALLLFVSGLAGLVGFRRWFQTRI